MYKKTFTILCFVFLTCGFILIAVPCFTSAIDLSRGIILDVPKEELESQFGKMPPSQLTRQDSIALASYRFTADTLKVLAILVEWDNRPGTYSRETFDSLLFSRDVLPKGSIADYFYEVSYGRLNVVGEVIDWYNAGSYSGNFDFEELFPILDPVIDYSQFDGNHDGEVDAVVFIRSGNGREDSGQWPDMWSFAYIYYPGYGPGPFDGVIIHAWTTTPETRPLRDPLNPRLFTGVDTLNRIRVFCHELAHTIWLPDLYDYDKKLDTTTYYTPDDDNDHPVNDWCPMGYGGYGLFSIAYQPPCHFCGWSKKVMGWINPIVLAEGAYNDIVIYNIETTNDSSLYMLPICSAEGEYFLLEYRNPGSTAKFDKLDGDYSVYFWPALAFGSDSLDRGLLITHVHDSLDAPWFGLNDGTPNYPHYTVKIEDAGYNPARDAQSNPEGWVTDSAQWWYPYETQIAAPFSNDVSGQEVFSPTTYPNSDGYFGPTGIVVRVDSIVSDKLYAYISNIPTPAFSLISPPDSALTPNVVTFDWTDPYPWPWDEVRYALYVSTSLNFHPDSTVIHDSLLSSQYTDTLGSKTHYWKVRAYHNSKDTWSTQTWSFYAYMRGDANMDGVINAADVVYLINYLYIGGPAPLPLAAGDVDCDGTINAADVVYLINYLYIDGPPPGCK